MSDIFNFKIPKTSHFFNLNFSTWDFQLENLPADKSLLEVKVSGGGPNFWRIFVNLSNVDCALYDMSILSCDIFNLIFISLENSSNFLEIVCDVIMEMFQVGFSLFITDACHHCNSGRGNCLGISTWKFNLKYRVSFECLSDDLLIVFDEGIHGHHERFLGNLGFSSWFQLVFFNLKFNLLSCRKWTTIHSPNSESIWSPTPILSSRPDSATLFNLNSTWTLFPTLNHSESFRRDNRRT